MRIVCWNVQGTGPPQENTVGRYPRPGLLDYLKKWSVDVAIILEPPSWMRGKGEDRSKLTERTAEAHGPVETSWRLKGSQQGHSQGHVFVVYKKGNVKVAIAGAVQVPGATQDNRVVFIKAEKDGEKRIIATCHTPYANNSGEAAQYNINVMNQVLRKNQLDIGIGAGSVDLWMGDLNTYGTTAPNGSSPYYSIALAEKTSGFGSNSGSQHHPLDKILVRVGLDLSARGRIVPSGLAAPVSENAKDIVEPDWKSGADVPSNHLPIYVDTTKQIAVIAPIVTTTTSSFFSPPDPEPKKKKKKI